MVITVMFTCAIIPRKRFTYLFVKYVFSLFCTLATILNSYNYIYLFLNIGNNLKYLLINYLLIKFVYQI